MSESITPQNPAKGDIVSGPKPLEEITRQMGHDFLQICLAPRHASRDYYDPESGLQVEPHFVHPSWKAHPDGIVDSIALRFSPPEGQTNRPIDVMAQWITSKFDADIAADMTRNLYQDVAAERSRHYINGFTGPIQLEVLRPGNPTPGVYLPISEGFGAFGRTMPGRIVEPQLLIGTVHYNTYHGPAEDHGIHGHTYPLTPAQLEIFAGALSRVASQAQEQL